MHDALALLSDLNDGDIAWILETGQERQVLTNAVIINEGSHPENLYIVLNGLVNIRVSSVGGQLAALGPGELLGEISFLEDLPASATVLAAENTLLLVLPRKTLQSKLSEDLGFASRLYRSFARITSRRLRERVGELGRLLRHKPVEEKAVSDQWTRIAASIERFKDIMQRADQEALRNDDVVPAALADQIHAGIREFMEFLNEEIGDASPESHHVKDELGARVQREFLPFLLLTRTSERLYSKPRGYTGDYLTIEWLYRNEPGGSGRLGPLLDRAILDAPAGRAVRNRRGLLAEEITKVLEEKKGKPVHVTSLASGPARELFDVLDQTDDPSLLKATLIDIDFEALAFVSDKLTKRKLKRDMNLVHANLVYLATGRQAIDLEAQDLVYSIGLIDYFDDKFVLALLNYVYDLLAPGGKVILGNFHTSNPCKAFIDYVLDWKMTHRDEADMNRLFSASHFGRDCTNIRFEDAGVNLFAECIK